jgi:exodeoxyribonuclease VII large subunit
MEEKIFSISEYIKIVDQGLKNFRAKIIGEVSKVDFGPTGNVYFYLKDEKDQSTLKCMIYKNKYEMYGIKLEEGVKIIAEGYPNLHRFYSFAFIAEIIEYSGEGTLRKEYEKLKKKLSEEGLFAEERKRSIPLYPQKIGVITSLKGGEVIADFSNNLGRFGFKVKMIDSRVEGQVAVNDLLLSIRALKKQDIEVLVIMRGGGSLESMMPLMPFNNELLIREVINFPVPVLAAIGHHKDVPLMALAADLNVSTPSIAATTLNESWKQATLFLERHERNIIDNYGEVLDGAQKLINQATETIREYCDSIIDEYREIENGLKISLSNFQNALFNVKINLDD